MHRFLLNNGLMPGGPDQSEEDQVIVEVALSTSLRFLSPTPSDLSANKPVFSLIDSDSLDLEYSGALSSAPQRQLPCIFHLK